MTDVMINGKFYIVSNAQYKDVYSRCDECNAPYPQFFTYRVTVAYQATLCYALLTPNDSISKVFCCPACFRSLLKRKLL